MHIHTVHVSLGVFFATTADAFVFVALGVGPGMGDSPSPPSTFIFFFNWPYKISRQAINDNSITS